MDEPRWLSADEQRIWRAFTATVKLVFGHFDRQLQRDWGIPLTYYEIFVALSEAPEHKMRMSELANFTRFSRSRLSHAVAKLEHAGWVRRTACPGDKRGSFAELTDSGYQVLVAAAPGHVEQVRTLIFDRLTDEQVSQLGAIAVTIRDNALDGAKAPVASE